MSKSEFNAVKDSGKRQEFATGSKRDTQTGKGRYVLISTLGLKRLAKHYENGSAKYGDRNWEKGQPLARYLDSCGRHLQQVIDGRTDEDHAAAVAWNIFAFIHTLEMVKAGVLPKEMNDMQEYWDMMDKYYKWLESQEEK